MRGFKFAALVLISLLLSSCSSSKFADYKDIALKYNLPLSVEADKYPEDDAVIILSETHMNMELYSRSVVTEENVHRVKKLFKNIEEHAFVEIPIYNTEKLEKISARTIKPDGTIIELKKEDFFQSTGEGEGSTFYSDDKSIKFTFPSIEKNCIVEYEYTKAKYFPFMTDIWNIQHSLPTLVNNFSLSIPKILIMPEINGGFGWDWNFKVYNYFLEKPDITDQQVQKDLGKEKVTYNWTVKDVSPLKREVMMPPVNDFRTYVKFAPSDWKSWNDISEWYYKNYFEPQLQVSGSIKELAQKLTDNIPDKKEKIRTLYDYVKNLRYVSISLGIGSIKPSLPESILERQYGDCKDKSILLIILLEAIDVESKPVLVLTNDSGTLDPMFPSWNFNHMIVKAYLSESKAFWIDPTEKFTPLGTISSFCENTNALVLNSDYTCKIEKIPSSITDDNNKDISLNINIKENGSSDFDVCINYKGANNRSIRYRLEDKTEKEMKEYCKSLIDDDFSSAEILSYELADADSLKSCYTLKFKGTSNKIMQLQGDLVMVASDPFKFMESTSWLIKGEREFPIKFDYPFSINKHITINLPEQFSIRNLPDRIDQVNQFMDYKKIISKKENSIIVSENFKLNNPVIAAQNYVQAKGFFESIKNKYAEKIILIKK